MSGEGQRNSITGPMCAEEGVVRGRSKRDPQPQSVQAALVGCGEVTNPGRVGGR